MTFKSLILSDDLTKMGGHILVAHNSNLRQNCSEGRTIDTQKNQQRKSLAVTFTLVLKRGIFVCDKREVCRRNRRILSIDVWNAYNIGTPLVALGTLPPLKAKSWGFFFFLNKGNYFQIV